jgi:hypothetical protein
VASPQIASAKRDPIELTVSANEFSHDTRSDVTARMIGASIASNGTVVK